MTTKPTPVPLTLGSRTLATAYPRRPPTARLRDWSWRMAYTDPATGGRTFRELGRVPISDVPETLLEAYRAIDPASLATDDGAVTTLLDLARVWYADLEGRTGEAALADGTMAMYRRHATYIRDIIGDTPLKDLRQGHLDRLRDTLIDPAYRTSRIEEQRQRRPRSKPNGPVAGGKGYGIRTVNQALQVVAIILSYGGRHGYAVPTPLPEVRRSSIRTKKGERKTVYRDYTPTPEEVEEVYGNLPRKGLKLFILLAWKTGGRAGEISALRWHDINAGSDGWYVTLRGKTGTRRVAIPAEVAAEAQTYRSADACGGARLFVPSFRTMVGQKLRDLHEATDTPLDRQWTAHGLRRRWSLDQIEAGVPVHVYADQSGHSPEIALRDYARVTDRDRRSAALRVADHTDIYAWLAEHGMSVPEAITALEAHIAARRRAGEHLQAVDA